MKQILITGIILTAVVFNSFSQKVNPQYDSTLAERLGADDYGMKYYTLVILKSGSAKIESKTKRDTLFRGHLDNIRKLAISGKLIVAGPLDQNEKSYRGIYILDVRTIKEAEKLLETDAAIKAGVFDTEIFKWYGSAALPEYLETHKKIEKKTP